MPIVCDQCGTENRETAKFCKGCAAKLPAFIATGPSALEGMKSLRGARAAPVAAALPPAGQLPIETKSFWVRFAVLSVLVTAVFVSWYAYVTRKVPVNPVPPPALAKAASPVSVAAAREPLAPLDAPKVGAPEPVRATEALDPTERIVALGPTRQMQPVQAPPPSQPMQPIQPIQPMQPMHQPTRVPQNEVYVERVDQQPRKVAAVRQTEPEHRAAASDPRPGCSHLHFIAASRCEANQCAKPQFYKHPHCAVVREQTRRDVARRNPLQLGY
ncbi:zinc ribbon domain-containing protein [Variovorax sp. KK3]|uniref:zinc ribbon domain-containing protein n=1 Tax=Variovorax sp. KK3 TaxID=1855728 RepID=UPI00097CA3F5|nr:zinc ribbon domain-containing protein [Variovorax sp. KK3]